MIKVTTTSGSVYEIYPDTKNYKRTRSEAATDFAEQGFPEADTGIYDLLSSVEIGEPLVILATTADGQGYYVRSTPVVSIEES